MKVVFKDALNLTTRTIDRRAFHFRNLVVLFVLFVLVCVAGAIVVGSWEPLAGLLALVPLCGAFLVVDSLVVNRWRATILAMWADNELDLDALARAVLSLRMLPASTGRAMLATLPTSHLAPAAARFSPVLRRALARTTNLQQACEFDQTGLATLAYFVIVISLFWTVWQWSWLTLLGCLFGVALRLAVPMFGAWRLRQRLSAHMVRCAAEGLDLPTLLDVAEQLRGRVGKNFGHV